MSSSSSSASAAESAAAESASSSTSAAGTPIDVASTPGSTSKRPRTNTVDLVSELETGSGFSDFFVHVNADEKTSNRKYKCFVKGCGKILTHRKNAVEHAFTHEGMMKGNRAFKAFLEAERDRKVVAAGAKLAREATDTDTRRERATAAAGSAPADIMQHNVATAALNKACAMLVVGKGLPLDFFDGVHVRQFMDEVIRICNTSGGRHLQDGNIAKRTAMTKLAKAVAVDAWKGHLEPFGASALKHGCTVGLDGRSTILQDPYLFYIAFTAIGSVFMGGVNAGANKKGTEYLSNLFKTLTSHVEHLNEAKEQLRLKAFAGNIFATIQDNASTCVSAGLALQEDENVALVALFCAAHGWNVYMTWLFRHIEAFQFVQGKADTLVAFFRKRPRAKSILKAECKEPPQTLVRAVPTRFASYFYVLMRLLQMRPKLLSAITADGMSTYIDEVDDDDVRDLYETTRATINDDNFWRSTAFVVDVLRPVLNVLRYFDRSDARALDFRPIAMRMGDTLAITMGNKKHASIPIDAKRRVMELLETFWSTYERDAHVAAYMLDCRNRKTLAEEASAMCPNITAAFVEDLNRTKAVAQIVLRRATIMGKSGIPALGVAVAELDRKLEEYFYGEDEYGAATWTGSPEAFWLRGVFDPLKFVGRVVTAFPGSTSDLERCNKINAVIHCSSRASLGESTVEALMRGYVALRTSEPPAQRKSRQEWFEAFDKVSDEDEAASKAYYDAVADADRNIEAAVRADLAGVGAGVIQPAAVDPGELEDADEEPGELSDDAAAAAATGELTPSAVAVTYEDDAPDPRAERRSNRRRLTSRFQEALQALWKLEEDDDPLRD